MSTALAKARPAIADVFAAHPDAEAQIATFFVDCYVETRAHEAADAEGADERARAETVEEMYEYDDFAELGGDPLPDFPDDVLTGWLAAETELDWRIARQRADYAVSDKVETYATLRSEGKTVVQAARKIGSDPAHLVALVDSNMDDWQRNRIRAGRGARREDDAMRAFNGRRRILSTLASKLTKEIETRDLSDVPADKLVGMLLKVCELSHEEAPNVSVQGPVRSV